MLPTPDEGVHAPSRVDVPPVPVGREFGHLTIEFGPDPDASTIGNALWAMAMLLGLAPAPACTVGKAVAHG
jgi:hypothetical protein